MRWLRRLPGSTQNLLFLLVGALVGSTVTTVATVVPSRLAARPAAAVAALPRVPAVSRRGAPGPPPSPLPTPAASAPAGAFPAPLGIADPPVRLKIPKIGVDTRIEYVGVTAQGNMDVPKDINDVAWYENGPLPGLAGDAVIDGHLDWYTGPAVFWHLSSVAVADRIEIDFASGRQVLFAVSDLRSVPFTATPPGLFQLGGAPRLSLITCTGQWDGHEYQQRLIVDAGRTG